MGFWDKKVVLITGATRGIGLAIARELIGKNTYLILTARSKDELSKLENELSAYKGRFFLFPADVSDEDMVKNLVDEGYRQFGRIDVLINNAGIGLRARIKDIKSEDLERAMRVNLFGPLYMMQNVLPIFERQNGGVIVNICSLGAVRPAPNIGGYSATKAALMSLADTARLELAPYGIKVINVFPGSATTSFRENVLGEGYPANEPRLSRVSPEFVASHIISGIEKGRRDIYITRSDWVLAFITRLWPGLADYLVSKAFSKN
ncbi:MAG: SDR family NAD(P)-dependent oxidoreductase [Thermoanaerobacteraceae bacterium]|nr:SDR family NAD(P)-dependent oxidoreductase [Thermoanaerobacteraceae bacterium]